LNLFHFPLIFIELDQLIEFINTFFYFRVIIYCRMFKHSRKRSRSSPPSPRASKRCRKSLSSQSSTSRVKASEDRPISHCNRSPCKRYNVASQQKLLNSRSRYSPERSFTPPLPHTSSRTLRKNSPVPICRTHSPV
jgi:hypothetical protein